MPGCTSAGADKSEIEKNIIEAIQLHIEMMKEEGLPIPCTSEAKVIELDKV